MRLLHLLLRPISQSTPKSPWSQYRSSSTSPAEETTISKEIFNILDSVSPIEPALEPLALHIKPTTVSFVLQEYPNLQLGFRFFIWAARRWEHSYGLFDKSTFDLLSRDSGFELYWKTLEELKGCGISIAPRAFAALIYAYAQVGMFEKSVESFNKMKDFDCKPDRFTYNSLLHVLVEKDMILLALAVYDQMLLSNCRPNRSTYNILIHGSCKSGKTGNALKMFDEMALRGISPDVMTFTIIISGLCRVRRADDALRLFNRMIDSGIHPNSVTCTALVVGFSKVGMVDQAFTLFMSFRDDGYAIGLQAFTCILNGLLRAQRFEEALALYGKSSELGVEPDLFLHALMIRVISNAQGLQAALKLLKEITERGFVPDIACYNNLIKAFCDTDLLKEAQSMLHLMSKQGCVPNVVTYTMLISCMCRNGRLREALEMFNVMEKLKCYPSVVTFNTLLYWLCEAGSLKESQLLFCKLKMGRNPSLFLRLTQGADRVFDHASLKTNVDKLCESGNIFDAFKLITRLADSGDVPNIKTYNILMNGFCKAGNFNGAYMLFKELQCKDLSPDSGTYRALINILQNMGREKDVFEVLDNMLQNGCTPAASFYRSSMIWACRQQKAPLAYKLWLKHLRNHPDWEDKLLNRTEEYFGKGDVGKVARDLLEVDIKLNDFDSAPYNIWLIGMCQANRVKEALKIFFALREYNVTVTSPCCVILISGLCSSRNLDLAIEVFRYSLDKGFILMPRIINHMLKYLVRSEDKKSLMFDILYKMKSVGYNLNDHIESSLKSLIFSKAGQRK